MRVRVGADVLAETEAAAVVQLDKPMSDDPNDLVVLVSPGVRLERAADELRTLAAMLVEWRAPPLT